MKKIFSKIGLIGVLLLLVISSFATTYYVDSSAGLDSNTGTSTGTPWKTISKVNSFTFSAGDNVLFKRGSTWRETISLVPKSGSSGAYITYSAYGTGNKPLILGSKQENITSDWVSVGTNLWRNSDASFSVSVGNLIFNNNITYRIYIKKGIC